MLENPRKDKPLLYIYVPRFVAADIGSIKITAVLWGCGVVDGVIVGVGVSVAVTDGVGVELAAMKV